MKQGVLELAPKLQTVGYPLQAPTFVLIKIIGLFPQFPKIIYANIILVLNFGIFFEKMSTPHFHAKGEAVGGKSTHHSKAPSL